MAASIREGGGKETVEKARYDTLTGGSYRSIWWVLWNTHGALAAHGVHGQMVYVDPAARMVLVRFSSYPQAQNGKIDPTSLGMLGFPRKNWGNLSRTPSVSIEVIGKCSECSECNA